MVTDDIKKFEGFNGMPYEDSLGFTTIGYGTKLPLSETEATILLKYRLSISKCELLAYKPNITILPQDAQDIVLNMVYQIGIDGVMSFRKMWKALEEEDYNTAAKEMLDSLWAKQTPSRAEELAKRMAQLSGKSK